MYLFYSILIIADTIMKQLPDEKWLAELVEMARIAAQKAIVMYKTADTIATK